MHLRSLLPLLSLVLAVPGAPAQAPPPERDFAVQCSRLLVGDGTELNDAWIVVRGGKIESVGPQAPTAELPVVDARGRVVMAGIVAVDSDLAGARDDDYAVTPDVQALDGFDFEVVLRDALAGGVTTAYLSPGRERLISGQGAVVKTGGSDLVHRVLRESACLRVNFGDGATKAPRVFEPTVHPTDEDPLEAARVQTPTARISVLAELRALFAEARSAQGLQGQGERENRYDAAALQQVLAGTLPLRAAAWQAADIRRALLLQQELAVPMVLENPQEIAAVAAMAKAPGLAAVFRMPVLLGRANPGGEDRAQKVPEPRFDAPAQAAAAGLRVGIAPWPGVPMRDYLVVIALAVRHGLPVAQALRSIGADAAAILGVQDRVGTLAAGRDADFVVLSGDPLAIGTMVESTWIDGRRAFHRDLEERLLAVRCAAILDGQGGVHRPGVLLVQGSRIKSVGEGLSIPHGAQVIDLPGAVMTPGFVDAFSHLGLSGDGIGVPPGQPNQVVDQAIAHDDPLFGPALRAGVTTVLVSGTDSGGLLGGRITAVKTGARDHDAMVVRATCGLRATFDAIGPDSDQPLKEALDRGKKYAETWTAYAKALADFKAGVKPAAAPAPPPAAPAAKAPDDPITGTWEATLDIRGQFQIKVVLELKLAGTAVTGQVRMTMGQRDLPAQDIESGSFDGSKLKFEFRGMGGAATIEGTVRDDVFEGTASLGPMGDQTFTARRVRKDAAAPAAVPSAAGDDGAPKRPDFDASLEPWRAIFDQRGALVVRVERAAAVRAVVSVLTAAKVPFVLHDPEGILDDPAIVAANKPPVLLPPDAVREERAQIRNDAAAFADLELPILFGTGDCAGARYLPLHAAYAVRYGLSPDDALAALTGNAARAFKLDDRIGLLQRGRDADFVVFSGDPFEPTSRVLLVGCNGEIAFDAREVSK